ncbi:MULTISPECIES: endonuclease MutS2 [Acidobacteriaceae]|uniref:endonuclease MutS2 n=1 Tax=Acidobacteriaceae TaxID=204434 RepID=UPI0020B128B7|nr:MULTISPECIES: Smr/MutS family protein [Acidobacteriaceae]MDW5265686.1 Smr/MutS family protein [Edaphobacter sp.]
MVNVTSSDLLPNVPSPLPEASAAALEWPRLREAIAGRTFSPLGRAWVLALEPSADLAWIEQQQQRTEEMRKMLAGGGSFDFHGLFDPTTLLDQARIDGAALEGTEIASLLGVVERVAAWRNVIDPPANGARYNWPGIAALSAPLVDYDFAPLLRMLRGKIEPDGSLNDDASPELRRIRRAMERQHRAIEESLRRSLRSLADGGSTQDDLITIRGERFVIPVKAEFKRKVPGVVHGSSSSGQTVFVEPLETIEQNNELVRLLDEEQAEIHRILVVMTRALGENAAAIHLGTCILAEVEAHVARARFAETLDCVRPVFTANDKYRGLSTPLRSGRDDVAGGAGFNRDDVAGGVGFGRDDVRGESEQEEAKLSLIAARHPLLELRMRAAAMEDGSEAAKPVPLTIVLPAATKQLIISGPNTGGKTVSLKTLGLLALMAQAGIPVPAEEARLPLFTSVYADIGDAQSIERNLSSFSAHVVNLDRISREATASSLVLLDELGSATDPEEGAALAVAVAAHFLAANVWCCITTHLTSLKVYAANHAGVLNAAVGFDQETLTPTYELRLGVPGASAGLNIAARLGLSPEIITAARAQMTTQTADIGAFLDQLHDQLTAATAEREAMRQRESELSREKARVEVEGRVEQKARTKELEVKLNSLIEDFAYQLRETVKAIDDKTVAQKIARDSAARLARLRREFSEQFNSTVVAHNTGADKNDPAAQPHVPKGIKVGDLVKLKSLGRQARVDRVIDAKTFEVSIGPMKMRAGIDDIAGVESVKVVTPLEAARKRGNVTVSTNNDPDYMSSEINVIGRTADEAHDEVERFLDRAFLAGLPRIRIVHGTGMGVLRRTLRDYLRGHPHVTTITEPPQNEGGQGATVVELRQ